MWAWSDVVDHACVDLMAQIVPATMVSFHVWSIAPYWIRVWSNGWDDNLTTISCPTIRFLPDFDPMAKNVFQQLNDVWTTFLAQNFLINSSFWIQFDPHFIAFDLSLLTIFLLLLFSNYYKFGKFLRWLIYSTFVRYVCFKF